ncbi:MAG: cytochrome C [Nitrospirae bacterium]|nr:cytochrome C [Nitrospirota bacterium]
MQKNNKMYLLPTALALFVLTLFLPVSKSYALPSFARQTGLTCYNCHTVFQELTPMGRLFKLGGFTDSKGDKSYETFPPLAVGAVMGYTNAPGVNNGISNVDKVNIPSEFNVFYGGRIYDKVGAFVQGTTDGSKAFVDQVDIRYANNQASLAGKPLTYGVTVNNRLSTEDVWNGTPVWGYPYQTSPVAAKPAVGLGNGTIIDGMLDTKVGGIGAYAFWNNLVYLDVSVYRSSRDGITKPLGAGNTVDTVVKGAVPYWRLAVEKQCGDRHSLMIGTFGTVANVYPSGYTDGPTDRYTDIGLDTQYQYITPKHVVSAVAQWIHEKQNLNATYNLDTPGSANLNNTLKSFKAHVNYYYRSGIGTVGGTAGYFRTTGTSDEVLYSGSLNPNAVGKPDSDGFIFEANYLPIPQIKLAIQYIAYNKFDGARSNYDGAGTSASHNNTLYFYTRIMY